MTSARPYTKMSMMAAPEWTIEYYVDDSGQAPVREFLGSLDAKTLVRFQWSLEQLRLRNVQAREPLVRHVEGKVWELREESRTDIYRILYVFVSGRRIVLLHGFQKKTQKIPVSELELAHHRLQRLMEREEGKQS